MDVDEFKEKVRQGPFLPSLVWTKHHAIKTPAVMQGDFLEDGLPLGHDFDLIIGNPPWESRGRKQIALRFVDCSLNFMCNETQDASFADRLFLSTVMGLLISIGSRA